MSENPTRKNPADLNLQQDFISTTGVVDFREIILQIKAKFFLPKLNPYELRFSFDAENKVSDTRHTLFAIKNLYNALLQRYAFVSNSWWPTTVSKEEERQFEIIIGVILTQNTNWNNVVKSIGNLKRENLINIDRMKDIDKYSLEEIIRPSGFFGQKAAYLKNICDFFSEYPMTQIIGMNTAKARGLLLDVVGIGKESADSILLYALGHPVFVIDAYTKRIAQRMNLLNHCDADKYDYDTLQKCFEENLEKDVDLFRKYHGLIVEHAKKHCRKKPLCDGCVLKQECSYHMGLSKNLHICTI